MVSSSSLLSILTPVRNGLGYIQACLDSVARARSAGADLEHVVVDGGSDDGTRDLLQATEGISLHLLQDRSAFGGLRNAIWLARGRFVLALMADDHLLPTVVDAMARLAPSGDLDMVLHGAEIIRPARNGAESPDGTERSILAPPRRYWDVLEHWPGVDGAIISTALARELRVPRAFKLTNDRQMMLQLLAGAREVWIDPLPIVQIVAHPDSRTHGADRDQDAIRRELVAFAGALWTRHGTNLGGTMLATYLVKRRIADAVRRRSPPTRERGASSNYSSQGAGRATRIAVDALLGAGYLVVGQDRFAPAHPADGPVRVMDNRLKFALRRHVPSI